MKHHAALLLGLLALANPSLAVEDATSSDIEQKLASHDLAVVEVYRPGCEFCLKMYPVIQKFEAANPSTPIYRVLVSDEEFNSKFKVDTIPAFIVFKKGVFSHAFFGLLDSDQFYQSVYFAPVAVRDPKAVIDGLRELMGDLLPAQLKLVKVPGGYYAIMDDQEKMGFGKVFLDGSVLDTAGNLVGKVYTPVPAGACCSGGKR